VVGIKRHGARARPLLGRRKRAKPALDSGDAEPEQVAICRVTVVDAAPLADESAAKDWLMQMRDHDACDEQLAESLRHANQVVRAHRVAAADPYESEVSAASAHRIRLGYGLGEEVAEGLWTAARSVRPESTRKRSMLDPDRAMAEMLSGRRPSYDSDDLTLRARLDLDQGRVGQALLQARAAAAAFEQEGAGEAGSWVKRLSGGAQQLQDVVSEMEHFSRRRMHGQ
jgi:hypothetical protein